MPRGKRRTRRKRNYKRKSYVPRSIYRSSPSQKGLMGFPKNQKVIMRYNENIPLVAGVGTLGKYVFRANSIYDPNQTGIGHQPIGRDEWLYFYNRYIVVGSKITVSFSPNTTMNTAGQMVVGIILDDNAVTPLIASEMIEQGLSNWRYMSAAISGQKTTLSVTNKFSAKRFFNLTDIKDNYDDVGAVQESNPEQIAYFTVFAGNPDSTGAVVPLNCDVTIEYIVLYSEPLNLAQS